MPGRDKDSSLLCQSVCEEDKELNVVDTRGATNGRDRPVHQNIDPQSRPGVDAIKLHSFVASATIDNVSCSILVQTKGPNKLERLSLARFCILVPML